jgi:hypothetical protein
LRFGQRMLGLEAHHAAVPGAVQPDGNALKGLAHGVGAASPEDIQAIDKTIDPTSYLRSCARSRASMRSISIGQERGDKGRADRAGWALLGEAKRAASQYGAAALAVEDPVKRAEIIAKGYNGACA